ncbi:hypothetical protein J1TS5_03650 [Paenibacillus macerans]|uniref:CARDB domain-containing protein n=1 Tax=Paenibacillus macerans TaxID=44252 RepID=UPI001B145A77|nr:CARDB domain-containing protein [Paenibacillus macerans]GIP08195.1 hypothetical protein J1TS5_03650 [Paenibacillus macerans]
MKKKIGTLALVLFLLVSTSASAAGTPMLKKYVEWKYGDSSKHFSGYVPALNKRVLDNPWELSQWNAIFNLVDGSSQTISNYDVFNVKRTPEDEKFDKENGFGLVYKSPEALGDLFDAIWAGQTLGAKQRAYFREAFSMTANDPIFKDGHDYYYKLEQKFEFLRTAGIIARMGAKFDKTKKLGEDDYQAIFEVSKWPTLRVTQGDALNISFTSYGYSERDIRIIAAPKGAFPDLSKVVSLTGGKKIHTDQENYTDTIKVNAKDISTVLGSEIDIIIDDGYGRTAIQSVKLPNDLAMDFIPTKLTLTESGQLWVKFRYDGDDVVTSDYVNERGMPMTAAVKIGGSETKEFNLSTMYTTLPANLRNGQEVNYMLGKVEFSNTRGTRYIKVHTTINNPSHPDRALESPATAYENNEIDGEWTIFVNPEVDLIAEEVTAIPSSIQVGGKSTIRATVKNDSDTDLDNVTIKFYDNDQEIHKAVKNMPANKSIPLGPFTWTGESEGIHNITVHVDPDQEFNDTDQGNNIASTGCVVFTNPTDTGKCDRTGEASGNWTVSYRYIYKIDKNGTHWKTKQVKYNEKLTVSAELDTKQDIPTKPRDQTLEGRESRGSWSIIPWAEENGLDASQITKAGYGIEFKVKTKYTTDWETKVPEGLRGTAKPIGTKLKGPDEVLVWIWDTRGKFVDTLYLEKTSGDDKTAVWELPEEFFESTIGPYVSFYERKWYTDKTAPDGEYTFEIVARYAGQNKLSACIEKKITIHGSMYEDSQAVRDTSSSK